MDYPRAELPATGPWSMIGSQPRGVTCWTNASRHGNAYSWGSDAKCGFLMIQTNGMAMINKSAIMRKPSK
jgi:hypothetical protein